jgi:hypothetical protein
MVQGGFSPNQDKMSPPARSVVHRLDNPRTVQPAVQREAGEEAILTRLKPSEADTGDASQSSLLWDDLDVAERVEHCNVGSGKIEYGRL